MYTLMMMTALSTSPDTAQFNGFFRDLFTRDSNSSGCHGNSCQGSSCQGTAAKAATSCQGSSSNSASTSCQGSSCHGSGLFHGIRSYFNRSNSSCNGSSCHGSSCQGSSAARASCQGSSCMGSTYASCMGSSCFGSLPMGAIPYSPMGGEYSQPYSIGYASPMDMGAGCLGGGGVPMGSYPMGGYPTIPSPSVPMVPSGPPMIMPPNQAQPREVPPENSTFKLNDSNRATVVVKLPADAKLYAEGKVLNLSSAERKFTTPPLPGDRDAVYTFRIEYTRDGEQVTQSKKVNVRAGSVAVLEFNDLYSKVTAKPVELFAGSEPKLGSPVMPVSLPATVPTIPAPTVLPPLGAGSSKPLPTDRAKITVKVPAGSVLFVDGKKNDRSDAVREFTTPALTAGKLYAYVMRIERGAEKEERKIEFMAGEAHTVDFTAWPKGQERASR